MSSGIAMLEDHTLQLAGIATIIALFSRHNTAASDSVLFTVDSRGLRRTGALAGSFYRPLEWEIGVLYSSLTLQLHVPSSSFVAVRSDSLNLRMLLQDGDPLTACI